MSEKEEIYTLKRCVPNLRVRLRPCSRRPFEFLGKDGGWLSQVHE